MSYLQQFGLSRLSPLNTSEKVGYWDGAKSKWFNPDDEGHDGRTQADRDKEIDKIAGGEKSDYFSSNPANDIINKNNQYSKEQLADYSYDNGYNIAGENTFGLTKDEMKASITKGETSKGLDMIKGGKEWKNSSYNTQPKKGYDRQGNAMKLHEGDKVTLDGQVVEDKDGQKFKAGVNEVQTGLEFASMVDPTGFVADGLNAVVSGARGVGALARGDYESAKKFAKAGAASTFFMIPGTDIGKIGKLNKFGKSKGRVYKPGMFMPESSKRNISRGFTNFAFRKGKNTKLNKNVASLFGGNFVGKKVAENTASVKGIKNYSQLTDSDTKEKKS